MSFELALTPAGSLLVREGEDRGGETPDAWKRRAAAAFQLSGPAGLFALAATRPDTPPSPSFSFWREFACQYMTQLCHTPGLAGKQPEPVEPPSETDLTAMLLSAPPMQSGEYLGADVFRGIWANLDTWMRTEIGALKDGLGGWLKKHAPIWHQVGRVCFHIAENKRDPAFPFAFMATYAPRLSRGGQVQYRPLGKALQEYAGECNKQALINLLSPVHRASEKGHLYQGSD